MLLDNMSRDNFYRLWCKTLGHKDRLRRHIVAYNFMIDYFGW